MEASSPNFLLHAGRIINSGQARTLLFTGNIHDLFQSPHAGGQPYAPLSSCVLNAWSVHEVVLLIYELNGPIRFASHKDKLKTRHAWVRWRMGLDQNQLDIQRMLDNRRMEAEMTQASELFDEHLRKAVSNPTLALEFLRQICLCCRTVQDGNRYLRERLILVIESADMLIPEGPIAGLSDMDRQRICICHDWFCDPGFVNGIDTAVLVAESRSLLNHRIARLPQLLEVQIPSPDFAARLRFIKWFKLTQQRGRELSLWNKDEALAELTAGLSLQSLLQLLKGALHENRALTVQDVVDKVEAFIQDQLGDDMVEFKKPAHRLDQVVGFHRLKKFLREEFLPRFRMEGSAALPGAAVSGPIGAGKTFIFEAVAAELDRVVLVIKNIRSQWFGQTDVLFERLKRVLEALSKVVIFIDEADTQLGGVDADAHETERRLTGKFQAMMSDPQYRGRIFWLLITARIHRLSPDLRRPGRVGDLIIPILDPEPEERKDFVRWMVQGAIAAEIEEAAVQKWATMTQAYSAAGYASLKSELRAHAALKGGSLDLSQVDRILKDHLPAAISETRHYQTLQALVNCTRRCLLPDPDVGEATRQQWAEQLRALEARGIR